MAFVKSTIYKHVFPHNPLV